MRTQTGIAENAMMKFAMSRSNPKKDDDGERAAILKVIAAETDAYLRKDYEAWASHWIQSADTKRMMAFAGSGVSVEKGWAAISASINETISRCPEPSPSLGQIERQDQHIVIGADMAWVYYDQLGAETGDPFQMHHLQHELKVLQKIDGRWRFAATVIMQQRRDFFDCPMIEIDTDGNVSWMNARAQAQLENHPALIVSSGRLRARNRSCGSVLENALAVALGQRVESLGRSNMERMATPVALTDEDGTGTTVCWVCLADHKIVITFDDSNLPPCPR